MGGCLTQADRAGYDLATCQSAFAQRLNTAASEYPDGELSGADLFAVLAVIRGRDSWEDAESGWLYQEGIAPTGLSPDMDFPDAFMRFEYVCHYPMALLFFHSSESEMVSAILSESGVFNGFTSFVAAFRHGKKSDFVCYYRDGNGKERKYNATEHTGFSETFPDRRLAWLS